MIHILFREPRPKEQWLASAPRQMQAMTGNNMLFEGVFFTPTTDQVGLP